MTNEQKKILKGFDNILQIMSRYDMSIFTKIAKYIFSVQPENIIRYDYDVLGEKWHVWESSNWKTIGNDSKTYNEFFSKIDGFTVKFGKNPTDEVDWCQLGPDIADIEIVAGKCPKINGKNCAFCYKNNGGDIANCMSLDEFKELLDFMPKNLCQIAFGITGYYTNPDFGKMIEYAKSKGVISNYTTNGVDIDDAAIRHTIENCGRVAVSCYEGAKDICYNTMANFGNIAAEMKKQFPCNIHVVLSKDTVNHVMDILQDAADGKIPNLGAIVILRMKPVGRAAKLDCSIPKEIYEKIVHFCLEKNIKFGFDSCGAKMVADVLTAMNRTDLIPCIESCESSKFSSYFNWKHEYWNCSFCEGNDKIMNAVVPLSFKDFQTFWNSDEVNAVRFPKTQACVSCPWYKLDD